MDGAHSAWVIIEAENKEQARLVLPPPFRSEAKITGLNKFNMEQISTILGHHQA